MQRIRDLVTELRAQGVEVGGLADLEQELAGLEQPGLWQRTHLFASEQWRRALAELDETAELGVLLARAASGEPLPLEEQARMREQLEDLVRLVPASALALTLKAIPGGALVTPWVLRKLNLLPSHWREAHLLEGLRGEAERLRREHPAAAARIDVLRVHLTDEGETRAVLQADLQAHWDADGDGLWDPSEVQSYDAAVAIARTQDPWRRNWYLLCEDTVFGPTRLAELPDDLPPLLVSWGGEAWVRFIDLRGDQSN